MGFGYGYSSRTDRGGKRYDNSMVAHVWNAQSESNGQSNNGNFYFQGRALYSYGSHFLVGYIMPDGTALLNGSSYSVSTSQHQSEARNAASNRATCTIKDLTKLERLLNDIAHKRLNKPFARRELKEHALALAESYLFAAGECGWYWNDETGQSGTRAGIMTAGEYLAKAAGVAASWPKLHREALALKAKKEAAAAKADADRAKAVAIQLADSDAAAWRRALSIVDSHGSSFDATRRLATLAKYLYQSVRVAKSLGFSAKRRAILTARHKEARARLANVAELQAITDKRSNMRRDIAELRGSMAEWQRMAADGALPSYHRITNLSSIAKAAGRLAESPALPAESRARLAAQAALIESVREPILAEHMLRQEAERLEQRRLEQLKEAEQIAAWRNGAAVRIRFDSEHGGAAIRIKDGELQTSHGASVPLGEAIRVFRFIKLVMARGTAWQRNGQRIAVGNFQVDSIEPSGAFVAGCHSFAWQEVKAAAIAAGVIDCTADDSAVYTKESAHA